ncbi:MAG: AAA family ATPase [Elusimicrobiota bacterium]
MYLKYLQIKNYRCVENVKIEFKKGVNVLIGENNTGKTSIIDALRLSFSLGTQRKDIFFSLDDFYIDKYGKRADIAEFNLTFSDISEDERGIFIDLLALENGEYVLKLHLSYQLKIRRGSEFITYKFWGGEHEGQNISYEMMDAIYYVYLEALRDAERYLRPTRENRLSLLLRRLKSDSKEQNDLANIINNKIQTTTEWIDLIREAKSRINKHLKSTSLNQQLVDIDFLPLEYRRITESLKMYLPNTWLIDKREITEVFRDDSWKKHFKNPEENELIFKEDAMSTIDSDQSLGDKKEVLKNIYQRIQDRFDLSMNGLGYNNLIYISTVIGDLFERASSDTERYVSFLIEEPEAHLHPQLQNLLFDYLGTMEDKNIQVFISSHSPTITAKTNVDSITVLQSANNSINITPIRKIPLDADEKNYLRRFLDVTKSQLFFSKGVILVEGISEALLLPIFADIMGSGYNINQLGIEVVNIGGVAFSSFAKLFNSTDVNERLNVNCSIITDGDSNSPRAQNARSFASGKLKVYLSNITFEYELYLQNENVITEVYRNIHPRFNLNSGNISEKAIQFTQKIKDNKDKAVFAQILAEKLKNENIAFNVPAYIQDAIKWAENKV